MKQADKNKMYEQITQHGNNLNAIFNTGLDPVKLCKRLRIIEGKAERITTALCNGTITAEAAELLLDKYLISVNKILGNTDIPVFINRDPRGYALKIKSTYMQTHNIKLYQDMGGYGILAPDFTPEDK